MCSLAVSLAVSRCLSLSRCRLSSSATERNAHHPFPRLVRKAVAPSPRSHSLVSAFQAGHYFNVKRVYVPIDPVSMKVTVEAMRAAITKNTIVLVASAPQYPHGVLDPIAELGELALAHQLPFHVDACVGGFILPWIEKLGYEVPAWDFRVAGVTSISADIHKYGYCPKGASTLTYRNASYRKYQFMAYAGWPGGLFVSPSMLGSRAGGAIAAAWAALCGLGEEGYLSTARLVRLSRSAQLSSAQLSPTAFGAV